MESLLTLDYIDCKGLSSRLKALSATPAHKIYVYEIVLYFKTTSGPQTGSVCLVVFPLRVGGSTNNLGVSDPRSSEPYEDSRNTGGTALACSVYH